MPDGIPVEGIQNVISTIEDETVRNSVQNKLDAFTSALDAEKEALDAGNLTEEEAEELRSSVEEARKALNEALEAQDIDIAEFKAPEGERPELSSGEEPSGEAPSGERPEISSGTQPGFWNKIMDFFKGIGEKAAALFQS